MIKICNIIGVWQNLMKNGYRGSQPFFITNEFIHKSVLTFHIKNINYVQCQQWQKNKKIIMAKITINHTKTIHVSGEVSINNGLLFVNGELFLSLRKFSEDAIIITIDGDLKSFTVDTCNSLQINGSAQNVKMESCNPKTSNDRGMSFGDEKPFSSKKFTEKNTDITINGSLESLTVESCKSLKVNGNKISVPQLEVILSSTHPLSRWVFYF